MCNLIIFCKCREWCDDHHYSPVLEHFRRPPGSLLGPYEVMPTPASASSRLLPVSLTMPSLDISLKWNHTIAGLLIFSLLVYMFAIFHNENNLLAWAMTHICIELSVCKALSWTRWVRQDNISHRFYGWGHWSPEGLWGLTKVTELISNWIRIRFWLPATWGDILPHHVASLDRPLLCSPIPSQCWLCVLINSGRRTNLSDLFPIRKNRQNIPSILSPSAQGGKEMPATSEVWTLRRCRLVYFL